MSTIHEIHSKIDSISLVDNRHISEMPHSRHTFSVSPPALCRHVVIFFPYRGDDKPGDFDDTLAQEEIIKLFKHICDRHARFSPVDRDKFIDDFRAQRTAILKVGNFYSYSLRLKADLYSEYCTVSIFIDTTDARDSLQNEQIEIAAFCSWWRRCISKYNQYLIQPDFTESDILHLAFWDAFDKFFEIDMKKTITGAVIGDFRGVVVCPTGMAQRLTTAAGRALLQAQNLIPVPVRASSKIQKVREYLWANQGFFYPTLGISEQGEILNPDTRTASPEPNFILCEMLDGNAIYGSTLGNPRLASQLKKEPIPVSYFIIYNGLSKHQLGRLVQRQHTLGELRVAALIDRDTVRAVSPLIRELGHEITRLINQSAMHERIGPEEIYNVVKAYNDLGQKCHGGFLYRINRSEYYWKTLADRLPHTRERHIEGWQSYRRFVEVNLAQLFKSTSSVGERYKQLALRIDRLVSIFHSERQIAHSRAVILLPLIGILLAAIGAVNAAYDISSKRGTDLVFLVFAIVVVTIIATYMYIRYISIPRPISGPPQKFRKVFADIVSWVAQRNPRNRPPTLPG